MDKKEINFDAGFEVQTDKNGKEVHVYKDNTVFEKNSPVDVKTIKTYENFKKTFNTAFVEKAIEESKQAFKKGEENVLYTVQNGINSNRKLSVNVVKEKTYQVGFGEKKETITAPVVTILSTEKGLYEKGKVNEMKDGLKAFVESLK